MRKSAILALLVLTGILGGYVHAQDPVLVAKSEYAAARRSYDVGDFEKSITHLQRSEDATGQTNHLIQYLRIKSYYNLGQMVNAKDAMTIFFEIFPEEYKDEPGYHEIVRLISDINAKAERESRPVKKKAVNYSVSYATKLHQDALDELSAWQAPDWFVTFRLTLYNYELYHRYPFLGLIPEAKALAKKNSIIGPSIKSNTDVGNRLTVIYAVKDIELSNRIKLFLYYQEKLTGFELYYIFNDIDSEIGATASELNTFYSEYDVSHREFIAVLTEAIQKIKAYEIDQSHLLDYGYNIESDVYYNKETGRFATAYNLTRDDKANEISRYIEMINEAYF